MTNVLLITVALTLAGGIAASCTAVFILATKHRHPPDTHPNPTGQP